MCNRFGVRSEHLNIRYRLIDIDDKIVLKNAVENSIYANLTVFLPKMPKPRHFKGVQKGGPEGGPEGDHVLSTPKAHTISFILSMF